MSTINNAIDAATAPQNFSGGVTFGGSVTFSALASATTTDIVYIDPVTGLLAKGAVPSGGGAVTQLVTILTSGTSFTPNAKTLWATVELFGAGGGGGSTFANASAVSAGAGGGAGGYLQVTMLKADFGGSLTYSLGVGGTGGTAGNAGNPGTSTTIASLTLSATGGGGGTATGAASTAYQICGGGAGGSGGGTFGSSTISLSGENGEDGIDQFLTGVSFAYGGRGGHAVKYYHGGHSTLAISGGTVAQGIVGALGSGGSGGANNLDGTSGVGGTGGNGVIITTEYLSS